ncbi:DMT family transporter [Paenibacillus sp. YYML68]|uniref:EamA family transporter n=1 Tax=Paenibacillus sp. YYML68 TaxID=2909250 RepID=UPI00248FCEE5|nr:DMT family transporter [Paenibacillus sp. YYML68]
MLRGRTAAFLLVLGGAASFGLMSTVVKLAYGTGLSGTQVTTSQLTFGALLMWLLIAFVPAARSKPWKGPWLRLCAIGVFGLALSTVLYNEALSVMDASMAIVVLFQFTWITVVMEAIASRTWPKPNRLIAVAVILVGTWLSVNGPSADWSSFSMYGLLCGLGAAVTYALFLFGTGTLKTTMHPFMQAAVMLTSALPFLYILFPPSGLLQTGSSFVQLVVWGIALGLLGQVIPTAAYMTGIPKLGSSLAATLASMELPVAIISAYFLLQETVQGVQWFGMLAILAGIAIAERGASSS